MRIQKPLGTLCGLVFAVSLATLGISARHDGDAEPAQAKSMPTKGVTIVIELGLKDPEATGWAGELRISEGTVSSIRASSGIELANESQWRGRSLVVKKKKNAGTVPLQVRATLDAPSTAVATIRTRQGEFSFRLEEIPATGGKLFLDERVRVSRGPLSIPIVTDPTDDDFPAAAIGPDGTVWVAYVAYKHGGPINLPQDGSIPRDWSSLVTKGNGDQVKLLKFDGKTWSVPIEVSEAGIDVCRPSVAVDGKGDVHVAWSQNFSGSWDLVSRSYSPASDAWSRSSRLEQGGADINPVMATDVQGTVWLAYQGWQDTNFNILLLSQAPTPTGWSEPLAVSNSPANEWSPAIAPDPRGGVYIAFDSYEKGNYDVKLAHVEGRKVMTVPVAASPKFEARASIAVDKENRVWVAHEEADANWGKDFGSKWTGKSGVPFYLDRRVRVRVVSGSEVLQPKGEIPSAPIDTIYPGGRRVRLSMPRLTCDGDGRIWLLYRRHQLDTGAGEVWNSFGTYHTGDGWSPAFQLPNSENFIDNRPALVRLASGAITVIYSTDKRVATTQSGKDNDLHASLLAASSPARTSELVPLPAEPLNVNHEPVHPEEENDVQRMRAFRAKVGGKTYRLLRGEFHRHTEMSSHRDQDGPFEEIWRYGLDVAKMDWIGQGDHDNGQREYTWWLSQKQDEMYFHAPIFMPMFTYERSVAYPSGHRNVMFARRGIRPLPRLGGGEERMMGTEESGSPDVKRLYAYLKHFDGICASHTSATGMGTDWRDNDPSVEPVVEIYQGHRQNYEFEGAPQSAKADDTIGAYRPAGFVWNALRRGYHLGFEVSSDHVSTHLSYATVLAENASREAIVDAFKKRHCYGAQDNIVLLVKSGEHLMGDEFTTKVPPAFEIHAVGTAPIGRVVIIRGVAHDAPTYVYDASPGRREVNLTWKDDMAVPGQTSYYYVRIEQEDKKLAWASPMWVKYD